MNRLSQFALITVLACTGCVYHEPAPQPIVIDKTYDRSFDAALAAAGDVGVAVRVADRKAGRIFGTHGDAEVKIEVQQRSDYSVKVAFSPTASATDPKLGERWLAAYNRHMGR